LVAFIRQQASNDRRKNGSRKGAKHGLGQCGDGQVGHKVQDEEKGKKKLPRGFWGQSFGKKQKRFLQTFEKKKKKTRSQLQIIEGTIGAGKLENPKFHVCGDAVRGISNVS